MTRTGFTLWFTGLSGAGKTTLSRAVHKILAERGVLNVEILDGDEVRTHLTSELGFSRADRIRNLRRIGWICQLLTRNGIPNLVAAISPYQEARSAVREMIQDLVMVYVRCPLEVVKSRDVKGLYAKAEAGEIKGFTGIDDPYEEPRKADLIIDSDRESVDQSATKVINHLIKEGYLSDLPEEEERARQVDLIEQKMREMGYLID